MMSWIVLLTAALGIGFRAQRSSTEKTGQRD
jgi:hypothetical protein